MDGLKESRQVKQVPGENRRRWFSSSDMDLTVWTDGSGGISGFELCYDRGKNERALRWKRGAGFVHERVDDGESRPGRHKATPVLLPDGIFDAKRISQLFEEQSRDIDPIVADLVLQALRSSPGGA